MHHQIWIGLLGAALSVSVMVLPTLAAPIVDATSHTRQLSQAQANTQPETVQRIHIGVIGEVQVPGAYFLEQQMSTVTRALQMAGGITPNANVRQVQIRRRTNNSSKPTIINVDLSKLLSEGDLSQDIRLQEEDVVVVKSSTANHP